jgi:UDP-glucose 4-epimerase
MTLLPKCVVVTGGLGYIGSHLVTELTSRGYRVFVVDKTESNKFSESIRNVEIHRIDMAETSAVNKLNGVFARLPKDSLVVHLAANKSVDESSKNPKMYIHNNVESTKNLLISMRENGLTQLVFASSAAVYDLQIESKNVSETSDLAITSPYAESKIICEELISNSKIPEFKFVNFRFFNVAGASSRALVEKDGQNLIPAIFRAVQSKSVFKIFGSDYATKDGTCVRDYIDVRDLVSAIIISMTPLQEKSLGALNIGSGDGYSVLEIVREVKKKVVSLEFEFTGRRIGDLPYVVADSTLAQSILGWKPSHSLESTINSVTY